MAGGRDRTEEVANVVRVLAQLGKGHRLGVGHALLRL